MTLLEEFILSPFEKMMLGQLLPGSSVFLIAPHCDDEVLGCAGALLRYLEQGSQVIILYMTMDKEKKRRAEALDAWKNQSNVYLRFLEAEDSALHRVRDNAVSMLDELLVQYKPDVIFTPWILDMHSDHRTSSMYLSQSIVSTQLYQTGFSAFVAQYEVNYPAYSNYSINISKYMTRKTDMLNCYKSQNPKQLQRMITHLNGYRASQLNLKKITFSDAFFVSRPEAFVRLCDQLCYQTSSSAFY